MTFYQTEIKRIRSICYSNEGQISRVIKIRNFISSNFDEELNLEVLSNIQFTSKFNLLRLFKRYYGQTPKQYITDKRIDKSKDYLKEGMGVSETCYRVGFESPSSFTTLFKRKNGLTPTEFKKKQLLQSRFKADFKTS